MLPFLEYRKLIAQIPFGKLLPQAVYIHTDGFLQLPEALQRFVKSCSNRKAFDGAEFNLIKFHTNEFKVSFLEYPGFFDEPYPPLRRSFSMNCLDGKVKVISFEDSPNPPILHRKETFLPPGHPKIPEFAEMTIEAEVAGLFENTKTIGFRENWENLIRRKGYELVNGHLTRKGAIKTPSKAIKGGMNAHLSSINRHLTAINRNVLSVPMQKLFEHQFLDGNSSLFDFGCGKGDDLRELAANGIPAAGWDPVYCPDAERTPSDVVNLGFVINVIEDPQERLTTLREAFGLTKNLLAVSAMLGGESHVSKFQKFSDGIITKRSTFQKYYSQEELKQFIEQGLDRNAIAVSPGVFFVFQNSDDEEIFLEKRQKRAFEWKYLSERPARKIPQKEKAPLIEKYWPYVERFKDTCLDLGRMCFPDEFDHASIIRRLFGSLPKAYHFIQEKWGKEYFEKARQRRIEDLLVFLGLGLFGKRKPYSGLPKALQRDVKIYFGGYPEGQEKAKALLFSVRSGAAILEACRWAADNGFGYLDGEHSLQLHTSLIPELPPILRLYVGCATQLFGDVERMDLVKIHIQSKKISLMSYEGFLESPLPKIKERIKMNLLEQKIDFFDYTSKGQNQLLYLKSRYLHPSCPNYNKQKAFDEWLLSLNLFYFSAFGPPPQVFFTILQKNGLNFHDQIDY